MEKFIKELKENKIVIIVILLTVIVSLLFNNYLKKDYSRVNNDTTDFVSGKVVEVTSSEVEYDEELKINLGKQVVKVEILEGKNKGKTVSMDNYLTAVHNIEVKVGTKVIISADEPDGIDAYYTVYNFDRSLGMVVFTLVLFMAIITIGKGKGIKSIIGLAYTLYLVIFFYYRQYFLVIHP